MSLKLQIQLLNQLPPHRAEHLSSSPPGRSRSPAAPCESEFKVDPKMQIFQNIHDPLSPASLFGRFQASAGVAVLEIGTLPSSLVMVIVRIIVMIIVMVICKSLQPWKLNLTMMRVVLTLIFSDWGLLLAGRSPPTGCHNQCHSPISCRKPWESWFHILPTHCQTAADVWPVSWYGSPF